MSSPRIQLLDPALLPGGMDAARVIFREYADSLGINLCFQQFDEELRDLPGEYASPGGVLLLADVDGRVAACGAVRALVLAATPGACEMKRLYVRPAYRALGLGRLLARTLMQRAADIGYRTMLLDTLDELRAARTLYASLGFVEVPAYYDNPVPGVHYLQADLRTVLAPDA